MQLADILDNCFTIKDLLRQAETYLKQHDIESARLNVEEIYCFCRNISKFELRFELNQKIAVYIDDALLQHCWSLIEHRANHKPLQYLTKKTLFFNTELLLNENVLIPRPETEELTSIIAKDIEQYFNSKTLHKTALNILDICSGSGCITLALAQFVNKHLQAQSNCHFYGIDISPQAVKLANQNKQNLNLNNAQFNNISFEEFVLQYQSNSSKLQAVKYDYIVCNPPYISFEDYNNLEEELFFEPKIALTDEHDGLTFYRQIGQYLPNLLATGGKLYLECGHKQAKEICNILINKGFDASSMKDFAGIDRFIVCSAKP